MFDVHIENILRCLSLCSMRCFVVAMRRNLSVAEFNAEGMLGNACVVCCAHVLVCLFDVVVCVMHGCYTLHMRSYYKSKI